VCSLSLLALRHWKNCGIIKTESINYTWTLLYLQTRLFHVLSILWRTSWNILFLKVDISALGVNGPSTKVSPAREWRYIDFVWAGRHIKLHLYQCDTKVDKMNVAGSSVRQLILSDITRVSCWHRALASLYSDTSTLLPVPDQLLDY
jgi:hypothetical protein